MNISSALASPSLGEVAAEGGRRGFVGGTAILRSLEELIK